MNHLLTLSLSLSLSLRGWFKDKYVVAAKRVDADKRQDWNQFDAETVDRRIDVKLKEMPNNRYIKSYYY